MIWTALLAARSFLAKVPWQAWAIAAVLATGWFYGNHRHSQGIADERARWVAMQAEAKAVADEATIEAAGQRTTDTIRNTEAERIRNEATISGGRIGRDCARLRQAGVDLGSVPACD